MPRIPDLRRAFRRPGRRIDVELDDEFAFHLEMRTRDLIAAGWQPDTARLEALRLFGDAEDARLYCRQLGQRREKRTMRTELLDSLRQDLAFAMRSLRRAPGFTTVAVVTLALGVGANVTMFGIVDRLLLRQPEHVRDPELVRRIFFTSVEEGEVSEPEPQMSYPRLQAIARRLGSPNSIAGFYDAPLVIGEREAARRAPVTLATASYFPLLGVRPALGRFFSAEEDIPPTGSRVAVIGHDLWTGEFGGAPDVLGRKLVVAGESFEIIGVAPRGFSGLSHERRDVWVPMSALGENLVGKYSDKSWHEAPNVGWLSAITRIRSPELAREAEAAATAGFREAQEARWGAARVDSTKPRATLEPLLLERGPGGTPSARIALWLAGMSLLVLLIACANVANLLLARALRRRREIAVRVALGAGRRRLVSQLLTEGMLIAVLGGAAALFVAHSWGALVRGILLPGVEWGSTVLDVRMLSVAAAVVIGTGLLIGLVPALQASDLNLVGSLKAGAREGGGRRSAMRSSLVIVQAALSLVLLVGAGLFVRSLDRARSVELGFLADEVLVVNMDIDGAGYSKEESLALYERLYERLATVPGVDRVSVGVTQPFSTTLDYSITIPGRDSVRLPESGPPRMNAVTPEFLATMGTQVVAGRGISPDDRRGSPLVAIINETMARTLWPGRSPIGETICVSEARVKPCHEIVGVVEDARWINLSDAPTMQMYFPLAQNPSDVPIRVLYLRASGDREALVRMIRREVSEVAPKVFFSSITPLSSNLEEEMRPWRLGATVFMMFGTLALVLAALGLYSVIAYDVAQRTQEMGVRLALGAQAWRVVGLIVRQGATLAVVGIGVGGLIALAAGRWIGPLLFATAPHDAGVLSAVALMLLTVALAASAIPAWRATRVSPSTALRSE